MRKTKFILVLFFVILNFIFLPNLSQAEQSFICAVYFTGVSCPHCANTDSIVLEDLPKEYPNFIVIEYEIYQQRQNAPLLYEYDEKYNSGLGIPLIIFSKDKHAVGDRPILNNIRKIIKESDFNKCPLLNGTDIDFNNLDLTSLPGFPKIWVKEKILMKFGSGGDNELLKSLLKIKNLSEILEGVKFEKIQPLKVPLSGKYVEFNNAIKIGGWIFQWNGEELKIPGISLSEEELPPEQELLEEPQKLTLAKILSLAAVDAVNPCALAVLTLMLIAILTYNPTKKRNVLLAGLAFVLSVFIMYLIYGLIIIKSFQLIQALTFVRLWLYKILGGAAIILGIFNIRDFLQYKGCKLGICQKKSGSFPTEMPTFLRPRVKKIISGITSPKGAFLVGAFVTIFLLPCTIGPYIICGGILCPLGILKSLPYLLLYNLIFILPMLVIVLIVYLGVKKVEDVSSWKEKNIRYLHLIAGLIILILGIAMVLGLV